MARLTDTQLIILSAASQRDDHGVELPANANPYISHHLCMIGQICGEACCFFCRRGTPWRRQTREVLERYLAAKAAKGSRWASG